MPLERFDNDVQKEDQPCGADLIGRFPGQGQGLLDFWSIMREMCLLTAWFHLLWMGEEVNGLCANISGDGDECIQPPGFACARCFLIMRYLKC